MRTIKIAFLGAGLATLPGAWVHVTIEVVLKVAVVLVVHVVVVRFVVHGNSPR
jgi:hypothetical protein